MEDLKNKSIVELLKNIDSIIDYLYFHNKNYTKKQYNNILDLIDNIQELRERII